VEGPYCIVGGAVSLCQAFVLAHVLEQGFDQDVVPRGSFQPPEVLHEVGKTHNLPAAAVGEENIAGGRYARP
jgi:hypothetical protein